MRHAVAVLVVFLVPPFARAAEPDLSGGKWSGCWVSDKNGHRGPLRATFTKLGDDCYRVRFVGRFWKVVPFVYSVTLRVTEVHGDWVRLSGGVKLGPVLGEFRCEAVATATRFEATFTSKGDHGRFSLSRP
jgi:hypothetical protein